jgi:hypothetical protein
MKAMGGGGGSTSKTSRKAVQKKIIVKKKEKKLSHAQLAGKWATQGNQLARLRRCSCVWVFPYEGGKYVETKKVWTKADIDRAKGESIHGKKAEAAATEAVEEEVTTIFAPGQKKHEVARIRMADLAEQLQNLTMQQGTSVADDATSFAEASAEELQAIVECKQLQHEELEALEAIFMDEFRLSAHLGDLQEVLEGVQEAAGNTDDESLDLLRSVARIPPLEFTLQLTVPDEGQELVASLLLRVRFPSLYPTAGNPPEFNLEDVMVTNADEELREGVPLRTLSQVDEGALIRALLQEVATTLPEPCMYDMSTWVSENAFSFIELLPEFRDSAEL